MGRLLYCVPFGKVHFESVFQHDSSLMKREFSQGRQKRGTSKAVFTRAFLCERVRTKIIFDKPNTDFKGSFPKSADAFARRLIRHFFKRLSLQKESSVFITDTWTGDRIDVVKLCREEFMLEQKVESIKILNREYSLTHVRLKKNAGKRHEMLLCGQERLVKARDLGPSLSWLRRAIPADEGAFFYAGFLEGKVLDASLQEERLSFNLPDSIESEEGELDFGEDPDRPSLERLVHDVAKSAKRFLSDHVAQLEEEHWKRIREFCRNNPVYRPLLTSRKKELLAIPENATTDAFSEAIGAIYHRWKSDTKLRFKRLSKTVRSNLETQEAYLAEYRKTLRDINELAFFELAEYVVDRKAVIDFLWDRMRVSDSGKFMDEDAVHDVFFPRRSSASDIDWEQSQMWLIDERLMLQGLVASDLPLKNHQCLDTADPDRPDVAVYHEAPFDAAYAFGEGSKTRFTAVTIVEFKRPGRDNYTEDENPIRQVIRYIRKIRGSKARQVDGHVFKISDESPIHVYIVCHIVDSLIEFMGEFHYVKTQDGQGVLMYAPKLNAFIQIVSFEKLIEDARHRHQAFFEKLGLPET